MFANLPRTHVRVKGSTSVPAQNLEERVEDLSPSAQRRLALFGAQRLRRLVSLTLPAHISKDARRSPNQRATLTAT